MKQELAKQQFAWKNRLADPQELDAHILEHKSLEWETSPVGQALDEAGVKRLQSVSVWMTRSELDKRKTKFTNMLQKNNYAKALDVYIETRDYVAAHKADLRQIDRELEIDERGIKYLNDIPI